MFSVRESSMRHSITIFGYDHQSQPVQRLVAFLKFDGLLTNCNAWFKAVRLGREGGADG